MGTYLSLHFSVRARALSSLITRKLVGTTLNGLSLIWLSASITIPMVVAYGRLLDWKRWSQRQRAWMAFIIWLIPQVACFIWIGIEYGKFGTSKAALDYQL